MENKKIHILLADDDIDDCDFFQDAIYELEIQYDLKVIHNGVDLMAYLLFDPEVFPDIIFLDLNMPKKSGSECVTEIKSSSKLSHIPVVIYSTSLDHSVLENLQELGANYYIQKPAEFSGIKNVIQKALAITQTPDMPSSSKDNFIIQP